MSDFSDYTPNIMHQLQVTYWAFVQEHIIYIFVLTNTVWFQKRHITVI